MTTLPYVSTALIDSLNETPATWLPGFATEYAVAVVSGLTVMLPEVPVTKPWVAVKVVVWASYRVMDPVPTPPEKLMVAG